MKKFLILKEDGKGLREKVREAKRKYLSRSSIQLLYSYQSHYNNGYYNKSELGLLMPKIGKKIPQPTPISMSSIKQVFEWIIP